MNPPEPLSIAVAKQIFAKLVLEVLHSLSKVSVKKIKQWNTENKVKKLYTKINRVRKVKTLWQVDKPVDIKSFFCEPHILYDESRYRVNYVDELLILNRNIVIEGVAGQGKSIFLRHLCVKELKRGEYIPIFIELRKIEIANNLIDLILFTFKELDLDIDINQFNALANTGKIVLFLDAFDEIGEESKSKILNEIEMLCSTLSLLKVVVSTRPDSPIIMSPFFKVFKIDHTRGDEYTDLINKLSDSKTFAKDLIDQIKKHEMDVVPLLCTPLLITLLVITYKSYQEIPAQLSDFYDSLFQVLLQRHDGTKPGFKRQRNCSINDQQYRYLIESVSMLSKGCKGNCFTFDQLYNYTESAKKIFKIDTDSAKYIEDIIKITGIILKDGNLYRFIHKSLQEFFAASFIKRKSEKWIQNFYNTIIVNKRFFSWDQELIFLDHIDKYRFRKFFLIPLICSYLDTDSDKIREFSFKADEDKIVQLLGETKFLFYTELATDNLLAAIGPRSNDYFFQYIVDDLFDVDFSDIFSALKNPKKIKIITKKPKSIKVDSEPVIELSLSDIIKFDSVKKGLLRCCEKYANSLHETALESLEMLENEDKDLFMEEILGTCSP